MGNCVPVLRIPDSDSASKPKCLSHVNTERVLVETSTRGNSVSSQHQKPDPCSKSQTPSFREPSSKEDTFFDSHPWLDSDCEDFYSVNGDITPSLNDTPIRKSRVGENLQMDKSFNTDGTTNSLHKPSTNKLLIELFRESFNSDCLDENENSHQRQEAKPSICYLPPKSAIKSSRVSVVNFVCNGQRSQSRNRKPTQPAKCCFPNLVRSMSLSERKKTLSPA